MADIAYPPASPVTQYVAGGASMTIAQLLANFPASATYQGIYARVSNLYGSVDDILRCRWDGTNYNWVPQRDSFAGTSAATSSSVILTPLVTPPTLRMAASGLTGNMTITPSSVNAFVGQRFRVIIPSTLSLGVFTAQITGLIGSNITLLSGTTKDIEYGGATGWFQSS